MDRYQLREYMAAEPEAKLRDLVSKLIYDEIVALRIAPGARLNVNQIATSLGISRTPVAEAIAKLTDIGFAVTHPGQSGSYVLDLNLTDMISLYQVRSAIESEAAALAAYSADEAAVRELTVLAEAFHDSVTRRDIRGMKDTDMPFHRLLIDSCGNPYLKESYELLLPKLTMYQSSMVEFIGKMGGEDNPWMPSVKYNHTSIISAIRLRMPEMARHSMADHVSASLSFTSLAGHGADPFTAIKGK
ncbi:MAG: GntR family transcriptional regulator [Oscillospiraceae bacterium]|nr:GntR family transcriptional regulator [Oscillospiraceae bacterium]